MSYRVRPWPATQRLLSEVDGSVALAHDWFEVELPANVLIGEDSWLHSSYACRHYRSARGVRIGAHSGVYKGSFFDLGPDGEVTIGDYTTVVGAIIATNGRVTIGNY